MRRTCEASVVVEASPKAVWDVVSDVTRVGEWSGECRGCTWEPPATQAKVGVRFRGKNRRGVMRWTRVNEFFAVHEPHELVWRTMPGGVYSDSVEWRITLAPEGSGTRISESFEVVRLSKALELYLRVFLPAHNDRSSDLADDLNRLKSLIEAKSATATAGTRSSRA